MSWSLFSSGVEPLSWAQTTLKQGGWPATAENEQSLIAWALLEGGGGQFNPLNTSQTEPGSSGFNSSAVQNYTSWDQGVQATVQTINEGYPGIQSDLAAGHGLTGASASGLSKWSGGGYTSVQETWARAASYMHGKTAPLPGGSLDASGGFSGGSCINGMIVMATWLFLIAWMLLHW